jgi:uncharacterized membrane protein
MTFWLVFLGLAVLALAGGWWIDRRAAKRGFRVNVQHTGLRRRVTYTKLDDTGRGPGGDDTAGPGRSGPTGPAGP